VRLIRHISVGDDHVDIPLTSTFFFSKYPSQLPPPVRAGDTKETLSRLALFLSAGEIFFSKLVHKSAELTYSSRSTLQTVVDLARSEFAKNEFLR